MYHDCRWGTVCSHGFGAVDAGVACWQMGYNSRNMTSSTAQGAPKTIWMEEVACQSGTKRLQDCNRRGWGVTDCKHCDDVAVKCW